MNYEDKLEQFRELFETHSNDRRERLYPTLTAESVEVETGYKFDKVCVNNGVQRMGRYMVESRTGDIWGVKSWSQVNKRRWYGTLDTITQYDWSDYYGRPIHGTEAELSHADREALITSNHKKRGRKPKNVLSESAKLVHPLLRKNHF